MLSSSLSKQTPIVVPHFMISTTNWYWNEGRESSNSLTIKCHYKILILNNRKQTCKAFEWQPEIILIVSLVKHQHDNEWNDLITIVIVYWFQFNKNAFSIFSKSFFFFWFIRCQIFAVYGFKLEFINVLFFIQLLILIMNTFD